MNRAAESIIIFLKGLLMGMADIVPGISGGTVAFITGIYSRLISSLSLLDSTVARDALTRGHFMRAMKRIDFALFLPLGLGIGVSFLVFSGIITSLLESHPGETYGFFLGLIAASSYILHRHIKGWTAWAFASAIAGAVSGFLFSGLGTAHISHSIPMIFASGMRSEERV